MKRLWEWKHMMLLSSIFLVCTTSLWSNPTPKLEGSLLGSGSNLKKKWQIILEQELLEAREDAAQQAVALIQPQLEQALSDATYFEQQFNSTKSEIEFWRIAGIGGLSIGIGISIGSIIALFLK